MPTLIDEILQKLEGMDEASLAKIRSDAMKATKGMMWVPNIGPQTDAYQCEADELYFGGEVGGGKSDLGIGLALTAHDRSLILRRINDDARELCNRAIGIVGHTSGLNRTFLEWHLPDKRFIEFGGCQLEDDKQRYKGKPHDLIFFDEAADFTETQVEFICIWLRSAKPGQRCRIVFGSNPPSTAAGVWLTKRFGAWIDKTHPKYPTPPGQLRWYFKNENDEEIEVDGPGPYPRDGEMIRATSRTFIRSRLEDNPDYIKSGYKDRLSHLSSDLRKVYRGGDYEVGMKDQPRQVIPTAWIEAAQKRWTQNPPQNVPMVSMGVDCSGGGCFDNKTEILTDSGWKFFDSLMGTERVLSLNGNVSEWAEITEIHKYWHDGPLNVYDGTRVNFAITDNHNLLVRTNMKSAKFKLERYDRLAGTFAIKKGNTWSGASPKSIEFVLDRPMPNGGVQSYRSQFDFLDWAEFLGWFVSEGWASAGKRGDVPRNIGIAQNPGPKMEKIKALLTRMGIKWRLRKRGYEVAFTNTKIASFLRTECGHLAKNKRVPSHIKNGSTEVIERFLYSYHLGDGTTGWKGQKSYATSSKILADDIQEMLCKVGRPGKISSRPGRLAGVAKMGDRPLGAGSPMYTIYECVKHRSATVVKSTVQRPHYAGYVYCVSTPLRTIMVRRNGCPMWSGNSDPMIIAPRYDFWFAPLIEIPGKQLPMDRLGKFGAAAILTERRHKALVILDMGGGYGQSIMENLKENEIEVFKYNGNETTGMRTRDRIYGFYNVRSHAIWSFREALDPDQDQGSPIALPPDQVLLSDLTAPTFEVGPRGIKVETKESIVKRLGRSPDRGDAVIMSYYAGGSSLRGMDIKPRNRPVEVVTKRGTRSAGSGSRVVIHTKRQHRR